MKKTITITTIILLTMTGYIEGGKPSDDFFTVNVTKSYPKKNLILQDFMDVEYIPLETNDGFLCQGIVLAIGKELIYVRNEINDGDIFIFDRTGKALRKINRRGQGNDEYVRIYEIIPDEDKNEMYINEPRKILVYDLFGKYLRSFRKSEGADYMFLQYFDRENLIGREMTFQAGNISSESQPFAVISKKDGSLMKDIRIRFKKEKNAMISVGNNSGMAANVAPRVNSIISFNNSLILTEISSDTIFRLLPDFRMIPFIIRTPSIQSMSPEIFLFPGVFTDRYFFMEALKKVEGFPKKQLMYDKQAKAVFEFTVHNNDYSNGTTVNMSKASYNNEIAFWQKLEAYELVEAYKKGELKGRLKEIAAGLDVEDNPVIMLVKHKK